MDIYVIDTNIVYSAAMKSDSRIGRFIMAASRYSIKFYAPKYLQTEIENHFIELVERSKRPAVEVREQIELIYSRIQFISDDQIPLDMYSRGAYFARDVDEDDIVFVALNEYFGELLLTGDNKLYRHLVAKGYQRVINFLEVREKYDFK